MNNFEQEAYFYDKDFNKQEDVAIAGDCVQQLIAIIMKMKVSVTYNPFSLYMNDISFNFAVDREGYPSRSSIKSNEIRDDFCFARRYRTIVRHNYELAKKTISEALDKYGYAILRTVDGFLPFSIYRNENGDLSRFSENGHFIMIVSEDQENYYYIDQLSEVDEKYYVHIASRKDIGVCRKEFFEKPLSFYAKVITVEFDENAIDQAYAHGMKMIEKSVEHFYKNITLRQSEDSNISIVGGKAALEHMVKAFDDGRMILDKRVYNDSIRDYCSVDIGRELMNGATGQKNRRMVLKGFFEKSDIENRDMLAEAAGEAYEAWEAFKNRLIKKTFKRDFLMNEKDRKYVANIVDTDKQLFELMRKEIAQ